MAFILNYLHIELSMAREIPTHAESIRGDFIKYLTQNYVML